MRLWQVFVEGDMLDHTGITLGHAVAGLFASRIPSACRLGILFAANRFVAATLEPDFSVSYSLSLRRPRAADDSLFRYRIAV